MAKTKATKVAPLDVIAAPKKDMPAAKGAKGSAKKPALVTVEDVAALAGLPQATNAQGRQRSDLVGLMASEATLSALRTHAGFFEAADLDLSSALSSADQIADLLALRTRLANALALVDRNIAHRADPLLDTVSPLKKLIEGTPDGSRIRTDFAPFLDGWREAFPGSRGERAKSVEEPAAPSQPTK